MLITIIISLNNFNIKRECLHLQLAREIKCLFDRTALNCLKVNHLKEKIGRIKGEGNDDFFRAIACYCSKELCVCQEILKGLSI